MTVATRFTSLTLSVGPVDVYEKEPEVLTLLQQMQLEVFARRHELNRHLNNVPLRESCPVLMPLTALMLMVLSYPSPAAGIDIREGEITMVQVPPHLEPVTIGDLCAVIGVTNAMRHPTGQPAQAFASMKTGEAAHG